MSKCDFCSSGDVRWSYPALSFAVLNFKILSDGPWAACDRCHDLIEKEAWTELAEQSAAMHPLVELIGKETVLETMQIIHVGFKMARTGPAQMLQ